MFLSAVQAIWRHYLVAFDGTLTSKHSPGAFFFTPYVFSSVWNNNNLKKKTCIFMISFLHISHTRLARGGRKMGRHGSWCTMLTELSNREVQSLRNHMRSTWQAEMHRLQRSLVDCFKLPYTVALGLFIKGRHSRQLFMFDWADCLDQLPQRWFASPPWDQTGDLLVVRSMCNDSHRLWTAIFASCPAKLLLWAISIK